MAVGAAVRQRGLVDLIDLLGRGWLAMSLGAVVPAGLAARAFGLVLGLALGEGPGLAFAGAGRLVKLAAQALVLGLQVAEASLKGLAAGTRDGFHTTILGEPRAVGALPRPRSGDQLELDALNKYADPKQFFHVLQKCGNLQHEIMLRRMKDPPDLAMRCRFAI
jgi:hypothetical protein